MNALPRTFVTPSGLRLEGVLHRPPDVDRAPRAGVVVCHPHPAYGGTMDNPVVTGLTDALCRHGLTALRFNFRGVGRSEGRHGGGETEAEDVRGALEALAADPAVDPARLGVAGYSFGAWVGLRAGCDDPRVAALVAVAPPLSLTSLDFLAGCPKPLLAVVGDTDAYCPLPAFEAWVTSLGGDASRAVLDGTDHFFAGRGAEVGGLAARFLVEHLAPRPVA